MISPEQFVRGVVSDWELFEALLTYAEERQGKRGKEPSDMVTGFILGWQLCKIYEGEKNEAHTIHGKV